MRLNDFNSLLQEIMEEEEPKKAKKAPLKGKEKFLRESLLRATKDIDQNKLRGARKIEAYKSAYKEILEGYYPGQAWYNITTANLDNDFANGLTTKEVMTNIVEGLKKPTTKKLTKSGRLTESKKLREGSRSQQALAKLDLLLGRQGGVRCTESKKLREGSRSQQALAKLDLLLGHQGGVRDMEESVEDDYGWDSYDDDYFDDEYFEDDYSEYDNWEESDMADDLLSEEWTDRDDCASNILSKNTDKINNAKTVQELVQIVTDAIPKNVSNQPKVAKFLKTLPKNKSVQKALAHVYNFILADTDRVIKEECTDKDCDKELKEGKNSERALRKLNNIMGKREITEAEHYGTETTTQPLHKDEYDRAMSRIQSVRDPEKNLEALFDILVPRSGKADTVAGEAVRAMMRLLYRDYNDGDKFFEGYGIETCASPAMWLMNRFEETGAILRDMLNEADKFSYEDTAYTEELKTAATTLLKELRNMGDAALAPNEEDCLEEDISEIQDAQPTYEYDVDVYGDMLDRLMEHDIVDWHWVLDTLEEILRNDFRSGEINQYALDGFTIEGLTKEDYDNMDLLDREFQGCIEEMYNEHIDEIEAEWYGEEE